MKGALCSLLKDSDNIAIFAHISPDGDAFGSALAMKHLILNNFDFKNIDIFMDGQIGELYNPMLKEESINPHPFEEYDLAIILDCPNIQRTGKFAEMIDKISTKINIDHHETNTRFGTVNYVTPKVSSTCEMIYLIAKSQGLKMNEHIAKLLYQGIITDTNCYTSPYCTSRTHKIISELMQHDFDSNKIREYYFRNNSQAKTKLLAKALQSIRFYNDNKLTTMKICHETFTKAKASFEDTLGIIDNGINIHGTEVSAILIEKEPNQIHCSLRSKGNVDVGMIAKEFNGGGSLKLSAFQSEGDIKEIEQKLIDTIIPLIPETTEENEIVF